LFAFGNKTLLFEKRFLIHCLKCIIVISLKILISVDAANEQGNTEPERVQDVWRTITIQYIRYQSKFQRQVYQYIITWLLHGFQDHHLKSLPTVEVVFHIYFCFSLLAGGRSKSLDA